MKRMSGWKTWVAGLGLIGYGLYIGFTTQNWNEATVKITEGMAVIGLGHKIEKQKK